MKLGERFDSVRILTVFKRVKAVNGNVSQAVVIDFVLVLLVNKKYFAARRLEYAVNVIGHKLLVNGNNDVAGADGCHICKSVFISVVGDHADFLAVITHIEQSVAQSVELISVFGVGYVVMLIALFHLKGASVCKQFKALVKHFAYCRKIPDLVERLQINHSFSLFSLVFLFLF